jgi:hypothetical protein
MRFRGPKGLRDTYGEGQDRLEQLTLSCAVLGSPTHMNDHLFLSAAKRKDPDHDHLAMLGRQLFAFAD